MMTRRAGWRLGRMWFGIGRMGLPERLLAILLLVTALDIAANIVVFDRSNSIELRQDDATRIAENLVLARRALEATPVGGRDAAAASLSTGRFVLDWVPRALPLPLAEGQGALQRQVMAAAPELARAQLRMRLSGHDEAGGAARDDGDDASVTGALVLEDGSALVFRTHARAAWSLAPGRLVGFAFPGVLLVLIAWLLVRKTLRPLRTLVRATRAFGVGPPKPVPESGPEELRELTRAFNQMQQRIHRQLRDRTQTMLAIGHDLRTPLSRMSLRLDDPTIDAEVRDGIEGDIEEMRHLLDSLQAYVDAGGTTIPAERIDVAVMAATLVDTAADAGGAAIYEGPESLEIIARPVSIRRALSNLIENALRYGGEARVSLEAEPRHVVIRVADAGPGIPEESMADALQPFVRLDTARGRDTAGMGLGLAIVKRAVRMEEGELTLANRPESGLVATIRLPRPAS